jgi:hypothetical protein
MADTTDEKHDLNEKGSAVPDATPTKPSLIKPAANEKKGGEVPSQSTAEEPRDVERGQDDPPAEPPADQPMRTVQSAGEDYSVLTVTQKRLTVMAASLASLFSPMATAIYCVPPTFNPPMESTDFHRSIS